MSGVGASPNAMLNRILITSTYRTLLRSAIRIDNNPSLRTSMISLSFLADAQQASLNPATNAGSGPSTKKGNPFAGASLEDFLLELNAGTEMHLQDPSIVATLEALTADFTSSSGSSNMTVSDYYVFHYLRKRIGMMRKALPIAARPFPTAPDATSKKSHSKKSKGGKVSATDDTPRYELSPSFAHYVALGVDPASMVIYHPHKATSDSSDVVHFMPPEVVSSLRFIFRTLPFSMQQLNVAFSIVKYLSFLGKIVNSNQKTIYMLPNVFPENPSLLAAAKSSSSAVSKVGRTSQVLEELLKTEGVCNYSLVKLKEDGNATTAITTCGISSSQCNFERFGGIKIRPVIVPNSASEKDFLTGVGGVTADGTTETTKTSAEESISTTTAAAPSVGLQLLVAHPLMLEYFANSIIVMGYIQNFTLQGAITRRFRNQTLKKKEFGLKLSKIAKENPELAEELKKISSQIDASNNKILPSATTTSDDSSAPSATISPEEEALRRKLTGHAVGFVINKPFCGADGMPLPLWSVIPISDLEAHDAKMAANSAVALAMEDDNTAITKTSSGEESAAAGGNINQLFSKYLQHNIVFLGGPVMSPDCDFPEPDTPPPHEGGAPPNPPTNRRGSYTQSAVFLIHPFASVRGSSKVAGGESTTASGKHSGLYLSGNFGDLYELFERGEAKPEDVMVILGYSSWGEGQLDNEIRKMGSWITLERKVEFAEEQQQPGTKKQDIISNADFVLSYNQVATDYDKLLPRRGGVSPVGGYASSASINAPSSDKNSNEEDIISGIFPAEAPEIISGDALIARQKTESYTITRWKELMNALGPQYRKMGAMGGVDVFNGMVRSYFNPKGSPRGV